VTPTAVDEIAADLGVTVDRLGYADLDQARTILDAPPGVLEALWAKVDALAKHRKIDPGLRRDILRVAEQVDPTLAEQLKRELDGAVPAVVLAAHEDQLIPPQLPALGAFPAATKLEGASLEDWLRDDPRRLRGVVFEVAQFCSDDQRVAEGVLSLAHTLGIDLRRATDVVGHALLDARHPAWAVAQ
jgi:hypothetical protein